jgi:integrase
MLGIEKIRDTNLGTRLGRYALRARPKPYYVALEDGIHLGYKKPLAGPGKWILRHCVGGRTYVVRTVALADDLSDANGITVLNFEQAQERVRLLTNSQSVVAAKHKSLTVAEAVLHYLESLEKRHKSARDARYRANAFILPNLGTIDVNVISADALRNWLFQLAQAPARSRLRSGHDVQRRRRATINRTLAVLKAALNCALREGLVETIPIWRSVEPFQKVESTIRHLTTGQAERLINSCDDDLKKLVEATLHTGARLSELAQVVVGDFNLDFATIAIRHGRKPRRIELIEAGVTFFRDICANRPGNDRMFNTRSKKWQSAKKGRDLSRACIRAGITPPIAFATLRHTYALLSTIAGVPLELIAKNLGHSDLRRAKLHCANLRPRNVQQARKGQRATPI